MKILIQYSEYSIKYNYYKCKELLKSNSNYEFGLIGNNETGKKYLDSKEKIFKQYIPLDSNKFTPTGNIDFDALQNFEKYSNLGSIWNSIASDRSLGSKFSSGSIGFNKNRLSLSRNNILEYYAELIKSYEKIFNEFNPDIFVPAIAMGDIGLKIFEVLCRKKNIKYLSLQSLRVKNYCSYANDIQLNFENVKLKSKEYLVKKNIVFSENIISLYNDIVKNSYIDYFDTELNKKALKEYKFNKYFYNYIFLLFVIFPIKVIYDSISFLVKLNYTSNSIRNFFKKICNRLLLTQQKIVMNNPKIYSKIDFKDKYIYYPLMSQPEYGINVLGTQWMNQIELIKSIAKNIPHDWYVYVKEHPAILNDRVRPKNYHNEISNIPNVKLIDVKENTNVLVQNSSAVFVISGTSGFEAILNDKPVFETRENVWSIMNLSKIIQSFENFADDLINEKNRIKKMNENDKKRIILSYLQSIEDSCFYATYPDILFYDRVGTEIEYEICGKELAKYFNKFINI